MGKWKCSNCEKNGSVKCELITTGGEEGSFPIVCLFSALQSDSQWNPIKDTGCSDCDKLPDLELCLKHQLEEKEHVAMAAKNEVERIKQKIAKENENELNSETRATS